MTEATTSDDDDELFLAKARFQRVKLLETISELTISGGTKTVASSTDNDSSDDENVMLAKARFKNVLTKSMEKQVKRERSLQKEMKRERALKMKQLKRERILETQRRRERALKKQMKRERRERKERREETKKRNEEKRLRMLQREKDKKKSKKKKKKQDIKVSNDDPHKSFKYWWSLGYDNKCTDKVVKKKKEKKEKKTKTKTKRTKKSKDKKKKKKRGIEPTEIDLTDNLSVVSGTENTEELTEHTMESSLGSSQQFCLFSPIQAAKKIVSTEDTIDTTEHITFQNLPMWWDADDEVLSTPPSTARKIKSVPLLLSPTLESDSEYDYVSFADSDDYDDVSFVDNEELSEDILDNLSCILDCSDDSAFGGSNQSVEKSQVDLDELDCKSISSNEDDCDDTEANSICSDPDRPYIHDETVVVKEQKHLGGVKIIGCRPSPFGQKKESVSDRSFLSLHERRIETNDGIRMVRTPDLFSKRKVDFSSHRVLPYNDILRSLWLKDTQTWLKETHTDLDEKNTNQP